MSSDKLLTRLAKFGRVAERRSISNRPKSCKVRRMAFERLENRRLFVADLVHFLTAEHVDINLQRVGSEWAIGPRNSDEVPPIQYANDEAVMYVGEPAKGIRPGGTVFDFTGASVGGDFYVLPMTQNLDLLYLGFAAYGLVGSDIDRYNAAPESKGRVVSTQALNWAKTTLADVRHENPNGTIGTGHFSIWQNGPVGVPSVFMASYNDNVANSNANGLDTTDGISADDALWLTRGSHLHYNFGFTQPGRYEVDLKLSAYFGDDNLTTPNIAGFSQSEDITLYFSVMSAGQLQFDASSYSVNEGAGTASINVVRVGGSDGRLTVNYTTANGTATAGNDYTTTSGTLEFLDGETTKSILVPILEDSTDESNETVNLTLSSIEPQNLNDYLIDVEGDANGLFGSVTNAVLTILDNDEPANTAPTISDVSDQSTDEDTPTGAIAFTIGDAQTATSLLNLSSASSNTALVPNANIAFGGSGANRHVIITPAANQFGTSTITLTVTDAGGLSASDTFLLTVNSINDAPTISLISGAGVDANGNLVMNEDGNVTVNFTVNDIETTNLPSNAVTGTRTNTTLFSSIGTGTSSRLRLQGGPGAARTLQVRPVANLSGTSDVTLTVTDGSLTASRTFTITVNSVWDAPTVRADNLLAIPGKTSTFDLLRNDTIVPEPGQSFSLHSFTQPSNGALVLGEVAGTLRYTPSSGFNGSDQFSYSVVDNTGVTASGIGYIRVADRWNLAPVHTDIRTNYVDGQWIMETHADMAFGSPNAGGVSNPTILDWDETVFFANPLSIITLPTTLDPVAFSFIGAAPGANVWNLPQSQNSAVVWPGLSTESIAAGIFASYTPVGDPRVTANAEWIRYEMVGFRAPAGANFSGYDSGTGGGPRVWFDSIDGLNGVPESTHGANVSDTFWITRNSHAHLNWMFTHAGRYEIDIQTKAFVNQGGTLVEVVSPVNTLHFDVNELQTGSPMKEAAPRLNNDSITIQEDSGATLIASLANDSGSPDALEVLSITSISTASHGTVAISPNNKSLLYTPNLNFTGSDSFTYTVTDEHGGVATAVVNVIVTPVNDEPIALADAFSVLTGSMLRGNVLLNDSDIDGDSLSAIPVSGVSNGTLSLNGDGTFQYIPGPTFNGTDSFTYRVSDGTVQGAITTVTITSSIRPEFVDVLTSGHADIGVNFTGGTWDLHIHQHEPDTEYEPDEALLYVGIDAQTIRNSDASYDFLGVPAGSTVYILPDIENTNLLFLGIGGEELGQGLLSGDVATLRLASVSGPGEFSVWQSGLTPTTPNLKMATSNGIDASDVFEVAAGSHSHANFAFTQMGLYEVTFVAFGEDSSGNAINSGTVTYHFQVGNQPVVLTSDNGTLTGEVQSTIVNTGTWADPELNSFSVVLTASHGTVVKNNDGTWAWSYVPPVYQNNVPVTITANDGVSSSTVMFNMTANTFAAGRSVFYNNATGENLSSAGAANNAIDPSKTVLRTPGAISTFANYTNYSRGLNGLIVDIAGLPTTVTNANMLASLLFAHWNAISAGGFAALPVAAVPTVTILSNSGVGGSARIKITFPNNTLQNTWLRVTVLANTTTGLAVNDVFYFGNVIGEVNAGNTQTRLRVNATDTGAVRSNQSTAANSASVTNIYDVNRDGRVNATDTGIVRSNQQTAGIVAPITFPAGTPPARARPTGTPPTGTPPTGTPPVGAPPEGERPGNGNAENESNGGPSPFGLGALVAPGVLSSTSESKKSNSVSTIESDKLKSLDGDTISRVLVENTVPKEGNSVEFTIAAFAPSSRKTKSSDRLDLRLNDDFFSSFDGDEPFLSIQDSQKHRWCDVKTKTADDADFRR